ncbi:right-handed parallel beta-helix repeat-containing protein [Thermosynechococcaceae cyanobacterium BACA0444]|uniref:Right-handed parallel beta-helix repeat-containing protein n=1 Tax=Pseudocalidococcus azoricus BACA0444 TaxID=2918990 RepID=A0AAE4FQ06_9CYAN|nr:right-handed parallel beta-helix repeat-containing protein [Pseudocalidococcus azoricus]MDS3860000.1 right-handed parallel beta-helix repeat-containing protein [Pseudocalidococcus azoricus BACA0444]
MAKVKGGLGWLGPLLLGLCLWAWGSSVGLTQESAVIFHIDPDSDLQAQFNQAATIQHQGQSVQLRFAPGIYRQTATFQSQPNPTFKHLPPVILRAEKLGTVIFTGADLWDSWQPTPSPGIYQHPWPVQWGFSGNPWASYDIDLPLLMQRGELAWVNEHRLQPVLTYPELQPGTFQVDDEQGNIYLAPPADLDWPSARVKISTRRNGLTLDQAENITLQNLIFEKYGGTFTGALTIGRSRNITVDHCQFYDNNWTGLNINESQGMTITNVISADNGMRGLGGAFISDLTIKNVESRGNNWRGHLTGYYDWDAGEKYFYLRRATFTNYRAIDNYAAGLWLDSDYQNIIVDHSQFRGNAVTGLFIEAGPGPITIKNSIITQNYSIAPNYLQTPGLFGWAAENVTLENNIIAGNLGAQIGVRDLYVRNIEIPEEQKTVTFVSRNWRLQNNWLMATQAQESLISTLNAEPFLTTIQSDGNHWFSYEEKSFRIQGQALTFPEWQDQTQQDQKSRFFSLDGPG